ncbi:response regulator transcription factor [Lachnospiraceae bacterium 29-91]
MRRGILTLNKILLVEDDMEISTMLKNFLETENFEVVTAFDGESACSKFLSDTFSLVLLDLNGYSVMKDGSRIELTSKEFEILKLLLQNPRKVYTKEQIYSLVWNDAYLGDENAVNVHISRLRNKIEDTPRKPQYVVTVWGIGYKLGDVRDE